MKLWIRSFIFFIALVLFACCTQVKNTDSSGIALSSSRPFPGSNGPSSCIESFINESGKSTVTLDPADNRQYEYLRSVYLEANQTPENCPELFKDLEKAREAALEERKQGIRVNETDSDSYMKDRDFMVSSVFTYAGRFYVTVTSTVKDGSKASYIRLRIKDKDGKVLTDGPNGWMMAQEFTNGKCLVLKVNLPLPTDGISVITLVGLETLNVNGVMEYKINTTKAIVGDDDPGMMEKIVVEHPADKNQDGQVYIGLDRCFIVGDDYLPMSEIGRKIKVPFKGCFRVPYKVNAAQVNRADTYIKLLASSQGGTTAMKYKGLDGSTFADTLVFTEGPNGSTFIEWDVLRADCWFDNRALYNRLENINWYTSIAFYESEKSGEALQSQIKFCASNDIDRELLPPGIYPPFITFDW